jgi:hypothetical protein
VNTAIVKRLETGSIKNVVLFGDDSKLPPPPYVVVKPEPGANNDRMRFRIIVHSKQGYQEKLDDYTFRELSELLSNKQISTESGKKFTVMSTGEWIGPIGTNDDHTIAMERVFFIPYRFR